MNALKGKKVLLVEDNIVNQEVVKSLLEIYEVEIVSVSNGKNAIEEANKGGIDCVLMDCEMPIMNGLEASRQIREANNKVPIIAISGKSGVEHELRCFKAGMNDFLDKPFVLDDLHQKLTKWMLNSVP